MDKLTRVHDSNFKLIHTECSRLESGLGSMILVRQIQQRKAPMRMIETAAQIPGLNICKAHDPLDDECSASCYGQIFSDDFFWS